MFLRCLRLPVPFDGAVNIIRQQRFLDRRQLPATRQSGRKTRYSSVKIGALMRFLFIHQNFPAQFRYVARALAQRGHTVVGLGTETARPVEGVRLIQYSFVQPDVSRTHFFARAFDIQSHRAHHVFNALVALKHEGFEPDTIVVHPGWGECLPVRTVFRAARIIAYCEFYHGNGLGTGDLDFDPELPSMEPEGRVAVATSNASNLLALADADDAFAPTHWQRSIYPSEFQSKIKVIHEGINTELAAPSASAFVQMGSLRLNVGDDVITYVARNLEPVRGFHIFMRALPEMMRLCPKAHFLVVGGDNVSYAARAAGGKTWREVYLEEVRAQIDLSRLHFLGVLKYADYLQVLKVSAVHVYLTHPFVLSWSVLEAMSSGCLLVASDTAPVREVVDGSNGFLVPFLDNIQLALTVADCVKSRGKLQRLRDKARADIRARFDLKTVCLDQTLAFLKG
jgi:glycosyltransferase involved in cell wall biosynthesis